MLMSGWLAVSVCSSEAPNVMPLDQEVWVCFYSKMETILEILELDKILVYLCICIWLFFTVFLRITLQNIDRNRMTKVLLNLLFFYTDLWWLSSPDVLTPAIKNDSICMFLFGFAFCLKHLNNVHLTKIKYWERIHLLLKILSKS